MEVIIFLSPQCRLSLLSSWSRCDYFSIFRLEASSLAEGPVVQHSVPPRALSGRGSNSVSTSFGGWNHIGIRKTFCRKVAFYAELRHQFYA